MSSFHDKHDDVARYYNTIATNLQSGLDALDAKCVELDAKERLRVFYDFFHPGEEEHYHFNMQTLMRRGHSFLDVIAPPFLSYKPDYIRIGKRYGRVLYLRDYPTILKDSMIAEMCNLGRNLMLSIDMISIPTSEAVKEVNNILLGIATNAAKWTQKQNQKTDDNVADHSDGAGHCHLWGTYLPGAGGPHPGCDLAAYQYPDHYPGSDQDADSYLHPLSG